MRPRGNEITPEALSIVTSREVSRMIRPVTSRPLRMMMVSPASGAQATIATRVTPQVILRDSLPDGRIAVLRFAANASPPRAAPDKPNIAITPRAIGVESKGRKGDFQLRPAGTIGSDISPR